MSSYGSNENRWPLEYTDTAGTKTGQKSKGEFYTTTTVKTDDKGKSYSITSVYEDQWGIGLSKHRFIGTVDSRSPNTFVPHDDPDVVNARSTGNWGDGPPSQIAYFSSKQGLRTIRDQSTTTTYNAIVQREKDDGKSQAEAERIARDTVNKIIPSNSLISPESSVNNNGFSLKPRQLATQKDEMAGKPGTHLVYPQDNAQGDFDFIKLVPIEYVPQLSSSGSSFSELTSVKQRYKQRERVVGATMFLPMVPGINESNQVDWGGDSLNPLQLAAGNIAANAIGAGEGTFGERASTFVSDIGDTANQMLENNNIRDFLTAYFAGQAVGANLLGRAGVIVNPNLEVLFNGPKLRTFSYNFNFTPRDDREAKTIRTIIKVVKKAMAPKRRKAAIFLNVPAVFKIKYLMRGTTEHPFLNKIKPCAMVGFNVDYTPDGSYMTYGDGSMTSYKVSMNLAEIEPIYNDDIELDSQNMGY